MRLEFTAEYENFRAEVRAFIRENRRFTAGAWTDVDGRPSVAAKRWQAMLLERGYVCRTIPKQYGGFGGKPDALQSYILDMEFAAAQIPRGLANQGISMLVPTLLEHGDAEQKATWIQPTISGEVIWCQGYSEPGAGSDLASLTTTAREDGNDFLINGQKIWTSSAHYSDMMFILVRTEPNVPKHAGISYLLLPMTTPGIEVRPLATMTGRSEFNEVFFADVRVPQSQVVGRRGGGWNISRTTLQHERGMLGDPGRALQTLTAIAKFMHTETVNDVRLMDSPVYRDRLLRLQARAQAMQFHGLRLLTHAARGEDPGVARLIVKLNGTELNYDIYAFAVDLLGEIGTLYGSPSPYLKSKGSWQTGFMFSLGLIIGGGTSQIQKNIISERGLGMPREPKPATSS